VYSEAYRSLDEVLRTVEALTADEVSAVAAEFFAPERQTVVSLGPTDKTLRRQDAKGGT
jgi:predicted Zn-dependent peptidase